MGDFKSIDIDKKLIETTTGTLSYDALVLATGTESNFFGMKSVKEHSLPLKTISDATNLRNHTMQSISVLKTIKTKIKNYEN